MIHRHIPTNRWKRRGNRLAFPHRIKPYPSPTKVLGQTKSVEDFVAIFTAQEQQRKQGGEKLVASKRKATFERGNAIDAQIAEYFESGKPPIDTAVWAYLSKLQQDYDHIAHELPLWSDKVSYKGYADWIGIHKQFGTLLVIDWTSSHQPQEADRMQDKLMQTAAYVVALSEMLMNPSKEVKRLFGFFHDLKRIIRVPRAIEARVICFIDGEDVPQTFIVDTEQQSKNYLSRLNAWHHLPFTQTKGKLSKQSVNAATAKAIVQDRFGKVPRPTKRKRL